MTDQDFAILIEYLRKTPVPLADQPAFFKAFERLISLQNKAKKPVTPLR